jgi:hypothetical protein
MAWIAVVPPSARALPTLLPAGHPAALGRHLPDQAPSTRREAGDRAWPDRARRGGRLRPEAEGPDPVRRVRRDEVVAGLEGPAPHRRGRHPQESRQAHPAGPRGHPARRPRPSTIGAWKSARGAGLVGHPGRRRFRGRRISGPWRSSWCFQRGRGWMPITRQPARTPPSSAAMATTVDATSTVSHPASWRRFLSRRLGRQAKDASPFSGGGDVPRCRYTSGGWDRPTPRPEDSDTRRRVQFLDDIAPKHRRAGPDG